jgi:transcriptional regulator with XRE-family HTH domain
MNKENTLKIKSWMVLHEVSQGALADELGVSKQHVSAWLRGKSDSKRIAEYLISKGCPVTHFQGTKYEEVSAA